MIFSSDSEGHQHDRKSASYIYSLITQAAPVQLNAYFGQRIVDCSRATHLSSSFCPRSIGQVS